MNNTEHRTKVLVQFKDKQIEILEREASKLGLPLATYCRMIIVKSLSNNDSTKVEV